MKKTTKTFPKLMNKYGQILTENDIKILYDYCDEHYYDMKCDYRINYCQAYFTKTMYICIDEENDFIVKAIFIKSYKTYVAVYLPEFDYFISFGRYSMSTYHHVRKYINDYAIGYPKEYNMEYVNWF